LLGNLIIDNSPRAQDPFCSDPAQSHFLRFQLVRQMPGRSGSFRGYAPTGKAVQWLGAALFRIQGHQIVELWVLGDLISLEADLKRNASQYDPGQ
jgi:hypothetical protein